VKFACACCGENLRGRKAARVRELLLCESPCAKLARAPVVIWRRPGERIAGIELARMFAEEMRR
jgi:hypothetical protein